MATGMFRWRCRPFVDDAEPAAPDDVGDQVFADLALGRHAAGGKPFGHDFGQEVAQPRIIRRDGVEIVFADFPHVHIGAGFDMGAARFAGEERHFADDIASFTHGNGVGVPVFFNDDGAGSLLDDETGIPGIALGDEPFAGRYLPEDQGIQQGADGFAVQAFQNVDVAEKNVILGSRMPFRVGFFLRRPVNRHLGTEREA